MTDVDAVRRELEARRAAAAGRVAELAKAPEIGEAQGFGKRIGDGTTEAISRLHRHRRRPLAGAGLARTDRALAKLDEGSYGICDACGAEIPPRRLEAMPDSTLCVACAAAAGRAPPPRRR